MRVNGEGELVYTVEGMSCGHCARAVSEHVAALPGVTAVDVELEGGRLTVRGDDRVEDEAVAAAVLEAGYELRP